MVGEASGSVAVHTNLGLVQATFGAAAQLGREIGDGRFWVSSEGTPAVGAEVETIKESDFFGDLTMIMI